MNRHFTWPVHHHKSLPVGSIRTQKRESNLPRLFYASLHSASLHEECLLAFKRKIKNKENTTVPINTSYNGDRFRKPLGLLAFPHKIPTRMFHIMSHPRFLC